MTTSISLFSGCGGVDCGLSQLSVNCLLAVDNDKMCAESFQYNFSESCFFHGCISQFNEKLRTGEWNNILKQKIDILVGGPPCPPFSKSRFYRTEMPRALDDPSAMVTVGGYLEALEIIKPKAFIFENVAGFAFKKHEMSVQFIVSKAESLGYKCSWHIVNAANYGVPQIRERFILVGMEKCKFEFPETTHYNPKNTPLIEHKKKWITAGDVLSDLDTIENEDDAGHFAGGKHHDLLRQVPPGDNYLFFTKERNHPNPMFKWRSRYWSFLLKLSPDLPSWTIQARRSNNMGPLHWKNRILRIEEVKRLQTFPDNWYLSGTVEQQWRQVGNAVPPLLAKCIGKALLEQLL